MGNLVDHVYRPGYFTSLCLSRSTQRRPDELSSSSFPLSLSSIAGIGGCGAEESEARRTWPGLTAVRSVPPPAC